MTKEEFTYIMEILKSVPSMNTVIGRQHLLDIVSEQAELESAFETSDSDIVDRLMSCVKQAVPLFSVSYCKIKIISSTVSNLAEYCIHCHSVDNILIALCTPFCVIHIRRLGYMDYICLSICHTLCWTATVGV